MTNFNQDSPNPARPARQLPSLLVVGVITALAWAGIVLVVGDLGPVGMIVPIMIAAMIALFGTERGGRCELVGGERRDAE